MRKIFGASAKEGLPRRNVDHLGFLLQLAELKLLEREKRASQRRLKAVKFANIKTMDASDFTSQQPLNLVKGKRKTLRRMSPQYHNWCAAQDMVVDRMWLLEDNVDSLRA